MKKVRRFIPILDGLSGYNRSSLGKDLIAGLTVATILIPQGMAYALLAGVPPIYGLYTSIVPLILYAFLGTSRHLSIGPVAISSLLVLSGVSSIAEPGTSEYLSMVITAGFFIGVVQLLLSFLRLGFLVNFISKPVIYGFTSAAAIIIISSQLKDALGIAIPRQTNVIDYFSYAFKHIDSTNLLTLVICVLSILIMWLLKKINKSIPGALIVVIIGILLAYFMSIDSKGVAIVGDIPQGLPAFVLPSFDLETIKALIPTILTVTTMGVVECIGIAKIYESKHKSYSIRPNQELLAIGLSKMGGAFFQSIPSSGSFSRSAINSYSDAKSTLSSIFTAIIICLTLLFLTQLFYFLPKAVLAAIILLAVSGLFEIKAARKLWKIHKRDFLMMLITFVTTLIFGIEEGVLAGVILSVLSVLIKSSQPHMAVLGKIKNTNYYRNILRFEEAEEFEHTLIVRFDDQLYFANSSYFKDRINTLLGDSKYIDLKYLVIDASNIHDIDSTGIETLQEVYENALKQGIEIHLCGSKGPIRDMLYLNKMMDNPEQHHMNVFDAICCIHEDIHLEDQSISVQTNIKD